MHFILLVMKHEISLREHNVDIARSLSAAIFLLTVRSADILRHINMLNIIRMKIMATFNYFCFSFY